MDHLVLETCSVDLRRRLVVGTEGSTRLSPKEASLLSYLAIRPGLTVAREELLREVWGYREGVVSRTLDTTVRTLRAKIEADRTTPSHVLTDPGGGYRFEPVRVYEPPRPAPVVPRPPPPPGFPLQDPNRFIGRSAEVADIEARFQSGQRLITLLGVAGVGKTRLARRMARVGLHRGTWPSGVRICDLSVGSTSDDVLHIIASVVWAQGAGRATVDGLGAAIQQLGSVLIVLDNADPVVEPLAACVARWLDLAPDACFLVTSRERLRLRAEHCRPVDPLPLADAIELLRDRAGAGGMALEGEDTESLSELARRLEGIPLALELAAARLPALGSRGVLARLSIGFSFLADESRDGTPRHATLHQAIQVSWDLLPSWGRDAWMQCAAFVGGFDLPAARAVIDLTRYSNSPTAEQVLAALAERCLVRRQATPELRFSMFESLRSFALKRLMVSERAAGIRRRHALWYLKLAEQVTQLSASPDGAAAEPCWYMLSVRPQPALDPERGNLLAAWQTLLADRPGAELARMAIVLGTGGVVLSEAARLDLIEAIRPNLDQLPVLWRARAWLLLGALRSRVGQPAVARSDLQRAVACAVAAADAVVAAEALDTMGRLDRDLLRFADATASSERALALIDEARDPVRRAHLLCGAGALLVARIRAADPSASAGEADSLLTRALGLFRRTRVPEGQAAVLKHLGALHRLAGRIDASSTCLDEALQLATHASLTLRQAEAWHEQGLLAAQVGHLDEGCRHLQTACSLYQVVGAAPSAWQSAIDVAGLLLQRGQVGAAIDLMEREASGLDGPGLDALRGRDALVRGMAEALAGRLTSAQASLVEAERWLGAVGDGNLRVQCLCWVAALHVLLDRRDAAGEALRQAREIEQATPAAWRMLGLASAMAEAWPDNADLPREWRRVGEALHELQQTVMPPLRGASEPAAVLIVKLIEQHLPL